jgi:hypothetical protein
MRIPWLSMHVLKIINKHTLQTGMQLYLIFSCDIYFIGHHSTAIKKISEIVPGAKYEVFC